MIIGQKRITIIWSPIWDWLSGKGGFPIGYFRFSRCECGCSPHPGWGMKFLFIGFSVEYLNWVEGILDEDDDE